jgi:hypothetical protein
MLREIVNNSESLMEEQNKTLNQTMRTLGFQEGGKASKSKLVVFMQEHRQKRRKFQKSGDRGFQMPQKSQKTCG